MEAIVFIIKNYNGKIELKFSEKSEAALKMNVFQDLTCSQWVFDFRELVLRNPRINEVIKLYERKNFDLHKNKLVEIIKEIAEQVSQPIGVKSIGVIPFQEIEDMFSKKRMIIKSNTNF